MEQQRIYKKARYWPNLPQTEVTFPPPPSPPSPPNALSLITMALSLVGLGFSAIFLLRFSSGGQGPLFVGFIGLSAFTAIGSFVTFFVQRSRARRQTAQLLERYRIRLVDCEKQLKLLHQTEIQELMNHDPPFWVEGGDHQSETQSVLLPVGRRILNNQDPFFWTRQPTDPDFLVMRVGLGLQPAHYKITTQIQDQITLDGPFDTINQEARALAEAYRSLNTPVLLPLATLGTIALIDSQYEILTARSLARAILADIAYHHSPADVRIVILASESQSAQWTWANQLPHTRIADLWSQDRSAERQLRPPAVALDLQSIQEHIAWISRETNRREVILGGARQNDRTPPLPYLVIVIDLPPSTQAQAGSGAPSGHLGTGFSQSSAYGSRTRGFQRRIREDQSLLRIPELALAISRGQELGCVVIALCQDRTQAPDSTRAVVELWREFSTSAGEAVQRGVVRMLDPEHPHTTVLNLIDHAPVAALPPFAMKMQTLRPFRARTPTLPTQVDIRQLFDPPMDISKYHPLDFWNINPRPDSVIKKRLDTTADPAFPIAVGARLGNEIQTFDFVKDGPHGLLIGQTGSGKSELLMTIITALAMKYSPEEMNFLLIDYKSGLALEPFAQLPHTVGFLTNVATPSQISRFIMMLRSEATRRGALLGEVSEAVRRGVDHPLPILPRLLIIIDEFAEMAKRADTVLDEIFSITKLGRELGMHLLLSAQRPEGVISAKVRDAVQYRFCLRVASPEDSREVLGRVDAAQLPNGIPGRGFLLHGDQQLELFQAARVTIPPTPLT